MTFLAILHNRDKSESQQIVLLYMGSVVISGVFKGDF